jgi:hypothetical protein
VLVGDGLNHRLKPNLFHCGEDAFLKNIGGDGFGAAHDVTQLKNKSFMDSQNQ